MYDEMVLELKQIIGFILTVQDGAAYVAKGGGLLEVFHGCGEALPQVLFPVLCLIRFHDTGIYAPGVCFHGHKGSQGVGQGLAVLTGYQYSEGFIFFQLQAHGLGVKYHSIVMGYEVGYSAGRHAIRTIP